MIPRKVRKTKRYRPLSAFGEKKTIRAWAEQFGLLPSTVAVRLRSGMSAEAALTTPVRRMRSLSQGDDVPNHRGGSGRPPAPTGAKICESCGTVFVTKLVKDSARACGRACADKLRAQGSRLTQDRKAEVACIACGKTRRFSPSGKHRKFCSRKCQAAFMVGPMAVNWKGGCLNEQQQFYASRDWLSTCRLVWARDAALCRRCGVRWFRRRNGEGETPAKHEVHHIVSVIDSVALRLDMTNLVLLCRPCHRFVHSLANTERLFLAVRPEAA